MNDDPVAMAKQMADIVRDAVARAVAPLADRIKQLEEQPGPDLEAIAALVPPPADGEPGTSVSISEVMAEIQPLVSAHLETITQPADGASVTVAEVLAAIQPEVTTALEAIPAPADGRSVTTDEARELLEGCLVKWSVDMERRAADVFERAIDKIPRPHDGRDAAELDDIFLDLANDGRTVTFGFKRADGSVVERSVKLPTVQYRNVHEIGKDYEPGDVVAWDGSAWIREKSEGIGRPSTPNSGWRLVAKRGRDGKDGTNGIDRTKPATLT